MNRRDAEEQRTNPRYGNATPTSGFAFCLLLFAFLLQLSCSTKPTDMRSLVPADTLVYLETNDLGAAIQPIIDSKPFNEVAKYKPDISAIKGVQLAVAVTGFETTEEKLTDEQSVGNIRPHFVAIADTHAWNWQAVGFAEKKLGSFVGNIYNSEPTVEQTDKNGGKYFTWTAKDGRKAYALVIGSLIYFANDESSIDKCLAVKRGETDSIAKAGKVTVSEPGTLASGYVGPDGIAQIANIVGLKLASEAGEDSEVQSAIAGILPQLLRNSITDITWTTTGDPIQVEDRFVVSASPDVSTVFSETLTPSGNTDASLLEFIPADTPNATLYNLKDPQISWRSVLLVTQKKSDPLAGRVLTSFSGSLFEPYGIHDAEAFLSSIGPNILTAKLDAEGEEPVVVATVKDKERIIKSLATELKLNKQMTDELGLEFLQSSDVAAAFFENKVIVGDADSVIKCIRARKSDNPSARSSFAAVASAAATTLSIDDDIQGRVVDMLGERRIGGHTDPLPYVSETRFTKTGIERRTVSDFGLIGSIIAQLAQD